MKFVAVVDSVGVGPAAAVDFGEVLLVVAVVVAAPLADLEVVVETDLVEVGPVVAVADPHCLP